MITFPNAKINLGLNIIEKRPDGYHNLETIFYPIHLQDALEVTRRENNNAPYTLHVKGTAIEGKPEDNLVVRAYELLKKDHDIPPVDIHLFKHIPTGAGLGGGSSDCAFMIKLLNEKFRLALSLEEMEDYAARLGADCAFFIRNQPVFEVEKLEYTSMDEKFMRQAMACVNAHIDDCEFAQADFTREMNMSRTILTEKLKSLTGLTPAAFIIDVRLRAAYHLLEEQKKMRIADLAYASGFNDPKYFSTCFRKKFGFSPKEFIDRLNEKGDKIA